MRPRPDEQALIDARALRDAARGVVATDLAVLRSEWTRRPLTRRLRDRAVNHAADAIEAGIDLARDQKWVIAATLAALGGWLFRNRLAKWAQIGWALAAQRLRRD